MHEVALIVLTFVGLAEGAAVDSAFAGTYLSKMGRIYQYIHRLINTSAHLRASRLFRQTVRSHDPRSCNGQAATTAEHCIRETNFWRQTANNG